MGARFRDDVAVITLVGRLDASLDKGVLDVFEKVRDRGAVNLVADCGGLEYLGSRGVSAFIAILDPLREKGGDLKLARVRPEGALILDRLGVSKVVQRFDTVEAAVAAFATPIQDFLSSGGLDVFVGSASVFHASACGSARRLVHFRSFASKKEARDAGLRPCRRCMG